MIEDDEKKDDNRAWDFGSSQQYPVPRCTPMTPAEHRLWYSLNEQGKPQFNRTRLNSVFGSAFKLKQP